MVFSDKKNKIGKNHIGMNRTAKRWMHQRRLDRTFDVLCKIESRLNTYRGEVSKTNGQSEGSKKNG